MYRFHLEEALQTFLAAFWRCVWLDLHGRGVTTDDGLPYYVRKLSYRERVAAEHVILKSRANEFLASSDFDWWATICGLDPSYLREALNADDSRSR